MSKKQQLLIGVNVNCKCGIILDYKGDDVYRELKKTSIWLEDFGFEETDVAGPGVWIWEGHLKYDVDYHSKEYDTILIGSWRRLAENEWKTLNERGWIWNCPDHND